MSLREHLPNKINITIGELVILWPAQHTDQPDDPQCTCDNDPDSASHMFFQGDAPAMFEVLRDAAALGAGGHMPDDAANEMLRAIQLRNVNED